MQLNGQTMLKTTQLNRQITLKQVLSVWKIPERERATMVEQINGFLEIIRLVTQEPRVTPLTVTMEQS